jgi:glycosyltransferase involved in cell wall biosynthesis
MKRTIVDVTQLVHWPGMLAGIPRVMNELSVRFYNLQNPNVVFVSWVKSLKCYCEIDFARTMAQRGTLIKYLKEGETAPLTPILTSSATSHIDSVPQALAKKSLPKKVFDLSLKVASRLSNKLAERLKNRIQSIKMRKYKRVVLGRDDNVFIGWGEWWDDNFISMLKTAVNQHGTRITQIIHDLGPIYTPQFSSHSTESLTKYCHEIVPICSLVLVVSEHAKKELEGWLKDHKYSTPPIRVFRNGDDFAFAKARQPDDQGFVKSGLKGKDFVLVHGTVEIRKNHMLYYYVYKLAKQRGIKLPKLLISGRLGWHTEVIHDLITNDEDVNKDILFLNSVTDEELSWLFDNAIFSMYVSFYEGWGVPVAESLARGTPCITANVGSMLEIADGIVYYSSPASTDELLAQMQYLLEPTNLLAARERTKKYKLTSWGDSFKQVNKHIKEVING